LLKELHILTRDGKLNQDSKRKLKQIYHLLNFIKPLLDDLTKNKSITLIDHGAGKSYLGFILYDLYFKFLTIDYKIFAVEARNELIAKSIALAQKLNFNNMTFINSTINESQVNAQIPNNIDIVTALHACDTATDDVIRFAINKKSKYIVVIPCCQAEIASILKKVRLPEAIYEVWRHPIHTREFGAHLTNVLRCLKLEAAGYNVTVTEFVGMEHSLKNELIIANYTGKTNIKAQNSFNYFIEHYKLDKSIINS
jgi:hypothetical protein